MHMLPILVRNGKKSAELLTKIVLSIISLAIIRQDIVIVVVAVVAAINSLALQLCR